jgi:hypothetical protein
MPSTVGATTALPSSRSGGLDGLLLDIGGRIGALIVRTDAGLVDTEIEVGPIGVADRTHAVVHEHRSGVFAAVFVELAEGRYALWRPGGGTWGACRVEGGAIAEVDVRTALS